MAPDRLELLHVHHQAAVAIEEHDLPVGTRGRYAHRERDSIADRAELADGEELLLRPRRHLRKEPRAVAAGIDHLPVARQRLLQRLHHGAWVEQPRLDLEDVAVGLRIANALRHRIASPAAAAGRQRGGQCLDAQARIGSQVVARHLLALAYRDRVDIDLQHLRLGPELAAAARMVGKRAANRDDEVRFLQILEADLGRSFPRCRRRTDRRGRGRAREAWSPAIHPSSRQAPGKQPRPCLHCTKPREHDNALGTCEELRCFRHIVGMRQHGRGTRQQLARRFWQSLRPGPRAILQIERDADHHRPALAARLKERAHRERHALGHAGDDRRRPSHGSAAPGRSPGCTSRSSAGPRRRIARAADARVRPPEAP